MMNDENDKIRTKLFVANLKLLYILNFRDSKLTRTVVYIDNNNNYANNNNKIIMNKRISRGVGYTFRLFISRL